MWEENGLLTWMFQKEQVSGGGEASGYSLSMTAQVGGQKILKQQCVWVRSVNLWTLTSQSRKLRLGGRGRCWKTNRRARDKPLLPGLLIWDTGTVSMTTG